MEPITSITPAAVGKIVNLTDVLAGPRNLPRAELRAVAGRLTRIAADGGDTTLWLDDRLRITATDQTLFQIVED